MSTLEELLRLGLPHDAEVLAGASHLHREVSWVARLRAHAPALPALSGGELVLISTATLHALDSPPSLAGLVSELAELGAAGAAVVGRVTPEAETTAERAGLPLISIESEQRTEALELELQHWLVQRKLEVQREIAALYHEFTGLALSGGFPALLERTVHVTRKSALLHGPDWHERLRREPANAALAPEVVDAALAASRPAAERWARTPHAGLEPRVLQLAVPELRAVRLLAGVKDGRGTGAYLSLVAPETEVREWDRGALLAAAGAGTIELVREHASIAARDEVEGDLLERLAHAEIGNDDQHGANASGIAARALRIGYDVSQPHVALALRTRDAENAEVLELLGSLVTDVPLLAGQVDGRLLAIVPLGARGLDAIYAWHQSALMRLAGLSIGLSEPASGVAGLAQALSQADQALELGQQLFGPGQAVAFDQLGIYRFLLRSQSGDDLRDFHRGVLGRLSTYDMARGAELLPTLEAYFASRCSPDAAARRLHLHRNSLLYRLRRIEEVAGVRLDDPETRLMLHLALRVGQVLELSASATAA